MVSRAASCLAVLLSVVGWSTAWAGQLRIVPSIAVHLSASAVDVDGSADSAAAKDRQATLADMRKLLKDAEAPKEYRSFRPVDDEGSADLQMEVVFRGNIATSNFLLFANKWPGNIPTGIPENRNVDKAIGLLLTTRTGEQRKFAGFNRTYTWQNAAEDALLAAARWCLDNLDRVKK